MGRTVENNKSQCTMDGMVPRMIRALLLIDLRIYPICIIPSSIVIIIAISLSRLHLSILYMLLRSIHRPIAHHLRTSILSRSAHKMSMSLEYTPDRATELKENMESVLSEIKSAASSSNREPARLVPISKLKPASDIQALYDAGYRHFGENYIQELADKAEVVRRNLQITYSSSPLLIKW